MKAQVSAWESRACVSALRSSLRLDICLVIGGVWTQNASFHQEASRNAKMQSINFLRSSINQACYFQVLLVLKTDLPPSFGKETKQDKTKPQNIPIQIKKIIDWLFLTSSGTGNSQHILSNGQKIFQLSGRTYFAMLVSSELMVSGFVPSLGTVGVCCNLWCKMRLLFFYLFFFFWQILSLW